MFCLSRYACLNFSTRGSLLGAEHFFKKYVGELDKEEPCCPLCHREFDTAQEVRELILEVRTVKHVQNGHSK